VALTFAAKLRPGTFQFGSGNVMHCAIVGSTPKRLNVCTSCLKAGKVDRA